MGARLRLPEFRTGHQRLRGFIIRRSSFVSRLFGDTIFATRRGDIPFREELRACIFLDLTASGSVEAGWLTGFAFNYLVVPITAN